MPIRQRIAGFLLGFCVMPMCLLFGGFEALLFHWTGRARLGCMGAMALVPLLGSIRSRQTHLTLGLLAGLAASLLAWHA